MAEPAKKPSDRLEIVDGCRESLALDTLIHEPKRLAIVSALKVNESLTFNDLKSLLELTDGNLSVHCKKLEAAGYIRVRKGYDGRTPRTTYELKPAGIRAFEAYLAHLEALIRHVRKP